MPSLKALRTRINSVKSTQKITSAMKMVAASKLRRAQAQAEAAQPYADRMARMLRALAASMTDQPPGSVPPLLGGTGRDQKHLIVSVTADRGLAGGFNVNSSRYTRNLLRRLEGEGKSVKLIAIGRKGRDYLRREFADKLIENPMKGGKKRPEFGDAELVSARIQDMLAKGEVDVVTLVYNRFVGVMSQVPSEVRLMPMAPDKDQLRDEERAELERASYEFEPDEDEILARLLPRALSIQIYRAMLDNEAGFYAAQMTAMDSATRNAGDMIKRLTLNYNRARQANITSELVEIISGAEAV
ncbi:F0F1 ATP synthase subunit gamma [Acidisoma sp.]|uniref:F0F1 ATP synthase subunit gamma n=1 Tax=Acidisoma sp. TaxID=1872115 RepID=UPI003AFFE405